MDKTKKRTITIFACVIIGLFIVSGIVMQLKNSESPNESDNETQTYSQTFGDDSGDIPSESKLDTKTALEIARADSKVQEMLNGRDFDEFFSESNLMGMGYGQRDGETMNILMVRVDGERYTVVIDENNTVLSAEKFDKSLINKH